MIASDVYCYVTFQFNYPAQARGGSGNLISPEGYSVFVPAVYVPVADNRTACTVQWSDIKSRLLQDYNVQTHTVTCSVSVRFAVFKYVPAHFRWESVGTAETLLEQRDFCTTSTLCTFKLQNNFDGGICTNVGLAVVGIPIHDPTYADSIQHQATVQHAAVTALAGKIVLSKIEQDLGVFTNYIHWSKHDIAGTGLTSTHHGQPSMGAYVGSSAIIAQWWNSAVDLSLKVHLTRVVGPNLQSAGFFLDTIGVAALALLTGPYTLATDTSDSRNNKFATYNTNGDCDKDALSGAAFYTLLQRSDETEVAAMLTDQARMIYVHWKAYRGKAIMAHVSANVAIAKGRSRTSTMAANKEEDLVGHSIAGILPAVRTDGVRLYVYNVNNLGEAEFVSYDKSAADAIDSHNGSDVRLVGTRAVGITPATFLKLTRVTVSLRVAMLIGKILLCEMTIPSVPFVNIYSWPSRFTGIFRPHLHHTVGWNGLNEFDADQYPHIMQVYSLDETIVIKTVMGKFPSVATVFSNGALSCDVDTDTPFHLESNPVVHPLRVDERFERQNIELITPTASLNPAPYTVDGKWEDVRLMHVGTENMTFKPTSLLTVGPSTYSVQSVINTNGNLSATPMHVYQLAVDQCN